MLFRKARWFSLWMVFLLLLTMSHAPLAHAQTPPKPKYIFLIIGDGMGQGHLRLGSIYQSVITGDQDAPVYWDQFPIKNNVVAGGESAGGGTSLATGYPPQAGIISQDANGQALTTILDVANLKGMGTGVITNSSITDATPATYIAHTHSRFYVNDIADQGSRSKVNLICGGGLGYMRREKDRDTALQNDAAGSEVKCIGLRHHMKSYADNGYRIFAGLEGAVDFMTTKDRPMHALGVFTNGNMIFQATRVSRRWEPQTHDLPTLDDMTNRSIEFLTTHEKGFVLVIEQALIDKASHKQCLDLVAMEMEIMNRTLGVVFDFYQDHPEETLIIFTADHECGYLTYDDKRIEAFKNNPSLPWSKGPDAVCRVLEGDWKVFVPPYDIRDGMQYAQENHWSAHEDNMALAAQCIINPLCQRLRLQSHSKGHSHQLVPLYAMGNGAERFESCQHIREIPILLSMLLGGPMLPLTVAEFEAMEAYYRQLDRLHTIPVGSSKPRRPHIAQ